MITRPCKRSNLARPTSDGSVLNNALRSATPATGAVVMGTGIVSVALANDRRHLLSLVLLAIAATVWVILGVAVALLALRDRGRVLSESRLPAALTAVAATAVLGARATGLGWSGVAAALLVIATALWLILLPRVLCRPPRRATGVDFMTAVSTLSLAVLSAQEAVRVQAPWLLDCAAVLFAFGVVLYAFVLARFDPRQLLLGHGDHWVSGGALGISTLAAARITLAARGLHVWAGAAGALHAVTLVLWVSSVIWLPALIAGEVARPRVLYGLRRWATVFPLGMYAASSFDAGRAARLAGLLDFARVWVWLAFALWLVVFAAMLRPSR